MSATGPEACAKWRRNPAWILVTCCVVACASPARQQPQYGPARQQQSAGYPPPGAAPPHGPQPTYGAQPNSGGPSPQTGAQSGRPGPAPAVGRAPPLQADPILNMDATWLRGRAQALLVELIAALEPGARSRVTGIPLVMDPAPSEVNAFAACMDGSALMAVSDGLLIISAELAQASANDELFGTVKVDEYIGMVGGAMRAGRPIPHSPPGFYPANQRTDPRRVARHHQLYEEQVAFVLAHELGHHYLGHLPCTARAGGLPAGAVARALSNRVPLFNQPNELAADVAGTNNILRAGRARATAPLTEKGGLLTMRFFSSLRRTSAADLLLSFERSHPPPQLRVPVIQQAANAWRLTGGLGVPVPRF